MEFQPSSTPQTSVPSGICTEPFCVNSSGVPYNRLCQSCSHAFKLRILDNLRGTVPKAKIPSSVLSHVREAPLFSSGSSTSNEQDWKKTRRTRPHITISHSQKPQYNHFNSHGEAFLPAPVNNGIIESPRLCPNCFSTNSLIGGSCSNCRPTSTVDINPINAKPRIIGMDNPSLQPASRLSDFSPISRPSTTSKNISPIIFDVNKMDVDAQGSLDLNNLEFSYPDISAIKPSTDGSLSNTSRDKPGTLLDREYAQPNLIIRPPRVPSSLPNNVTVSKVEPNPTKRQKLSHLSMGKTLSEIKPSSAYQPPTTATGPNMDKSTINSGRSLKLCSSSNCTGIISSSSSATRCLPCVRREWKSRRELVAVTPINSVGHIPKGQSPFNGEDHGGVTGKVKKKCVTWADDVVQRYSSPPTTLKKSIYPNGLVDCTDHSNSPPAFPEIHPTVSASDDPVANQPGIVSMVNEERPTLLSRSQGDSLKADPIPGWDSDLSDLSESPEADLDFGSPSKQEIKSSSGLKIRIPARPAGKKCASQKCDQMLKFGYQWKLCIMCRAKQRDVDRKKHNCVPLHQSLLEVLTEDETIGTPLSMDLQKHIAQVKLVQGARLCAVKSCTYVIPSPDEYSGKKCTFCCLHRAEREHLEKESDQRPSRRSKLVSQPSFWLQQLDHNRTDVSDESGRCRRYGCGMFLSSRSSRECKQCIGRRNWLTNKFTGYSSVPEGPIILHRGSQKPLHRPRGPAPYPKYNSFSAALKEFKGRLAGFLRVQSIFFLFHQPHSSDAFFAFDAEYSIVALDFDFEKRREGLEANVLKLKTTIEYVGRIKFNRKRLVSILEGGGVSIRFSSMYPVPMLQSRTKDGETVIHSFSKFMQCELEIAVIPDHSHRFIPGQRTVIRFRLFG